MPILEIRVPDIGDFDEVAVIELLVKPGDSINAEQSLITVESDKASMEIPSSHAGVVKELKIKIGDKVKQGSVVLTLEVTGAAAASTPAPASTPSPNSAQTFAPVLEQKMSSPTIQATQSAIDSIASRLFVPPIWA
jgi:pyruvate/2-oxoglutarate dehydrogenase complex dihydrolipoamide acyltransferase (E2) component